MKKAILFAAMFLFAVSGVKAQPGGNFDPEEMAKNMSDRMKTELSLNDDQTKQVYNLYIAQNKKMAEQMQQGMNGDRDAMREQMQKSREEMNKKMKEILTDEQYKKWSETQQRGFGGPGRQGGPNGQGGQRPM